MVAIFEMPRTATLRTIDFNPQDRCHFALVVFLPTPDEPIDIAKLAIDSGSENQEPTWEDAAWQ